MSYEYPVLDHVGHEVVVTCGVRVHGIIGDVEGFNEVTFSEVILDPGESSDDMWPQHLPFYTPSQREIDSGDENFGFECITCEEAAVSILESKDKVNQVMVVRRELKDRGVMLTYTQATVVTEFIKELVSNGTN